MYKKAMGLLVLWGFLFFSCLMCVKGTDAALVSTEPVEQLKLKLEVLDEKAGAQEEAAVEEQEELMDKSRGLGIADVAVSGKRVVDYSVLEKHYYYELSDADMEALLRIVEAEAGCEDEEGKLLVANVVLNRVESDFFPDTVREVVFQRENGVTQFSPVADGSYYEVVVSDETISAVSRALMGEDISQGALYFAARKYANSDKMQWFDENLTRLFAHGGHEFFK